MIDISMEEMMILLNVEFGWSCERVWLEIT